MENRKIYVVVPVYNESKSIHDLLHGFNRMIPGINMDHEILVINDGSADDSEEWILRARENLGDARITYIKHEVNKGLHDVLNTGFGAVGSIEDHDILVTMDGDNTHNPFVIKSMLSKIDEGADIVIASRYCEQSRISGLSGLRVLLSGGAQVLYRLRWRIPGVKDYTCLFRAYRGSLVRKFLARYAEPHVEEKGFTCCSEILRKMAVFSPTIVEVPIILRYSNKMSASNMNVLRTIYLTLRMLARR